MDVKVKKVGIIVIGDEILKGHVKDSNSNFLCKRLHAIGVKVCRISTVADDVKDIAEEVAKFSEKFDFVITTGGIGPTHDDLTYEAVAKALNDKIILHEEMAQVIKSYFHGSNEVDTNPALKMAMIPRSSKLIYILPKSEECGVTERHNGLQEGEATGMVKKPFPVVQVKNVFVLPGMSEWLEHAFIQLQDIFTDPAVNIFLMVMFLKAKEIRIVNELNKAVKKFLKHVVFGSYATDSHNDEYQTKITMESLSLDDVTSAYSYLKSLMPREYLTSGVQVCDAELVEELSYGVKSVSIAVRNSLEVIKQAFEEYNSQEIYLSFNGGKDCTVLLHLVWALGKKLNRKINTVYIKSDDSFREVEKFILQSTEKYGLNLVTVFGSIKSALTELHKQKREIKAIFMGTRRTDPYAEELKAFQMCDEDWPPLMRVNPILDWSYENIWEFLRVLDVPYCRLYDEGYTSIGNPAQTRPNPALKIQTLPGQYYPAYKLTDASMERNGRR